MKRSSFKLFHFYLSSLRLFFILTLLKLVYLKFNKMINQILLKKTFILRINITIDNFLKISIQEVTFLY